MKKNLLVLLALLILCGLVARHLQGLQQARAALAQDLTHSLECFWETRGHRVELIPDSEGLRARVRVVFPPNTSSQRKRWNFALLDFVARRHPALQLARLELCDAADNQPLRAEDGSRPGTSRPYAGAGNDENRAEIVAREAQVWLDSALGPDNALALVECVSRRVLVDPLESLRDTRLKLTAYVGDSPNLAPYYRTDTTTTLVVVVNGRAPEIPSRLPRLQEMVRVPRVVLLP